MVVILVSILIAEDDNILKDLYEEWIVEALTGCGGAVVEITSNGKEAQKSLERKSFDITILDMALPYKSGVELYKEFKESMGKIILASSYAGAFSNCIGDDTDKILNKPFQKDEFVSMVDDTLKESINVNRETNITCEEYEAID